MQRDEPQDAKEATPLADLASGKAPSKKPAKKPSLFCAGSRKRSGYHDISTAPEPKGCGCVIA